MKIALIGVLMLAVSIAPGSMALAQSSAPPRGAPAGPHPPGPGAGGPGMPGGPGGMMHGGMMGRPDGLMRGAAGGLCPVPLMAGGQLDARALQMCGEILRAVGDIMMKYGKAMESPTR